MSNETYPCWGLTGPEWPGMRLSIVRRVKWKTAVNESGSGVEARHTYSTQGRVSWEIEYEFVYQADASWLFGFFNARRGSLDNFLLLDPFDGLTYRVRFEEDTLEMEHLPFVRAGVFPSWWKTTVKLIEVIGEGA